jgi:transposase
MPDDVVEVIVGHQRRRRWTVQEKLRIVAESNEPGARIGDIAARYDLYPSLLFTWRRQVRNGSLKERRSPLFLPIETTDPRAPPSPSDRSDSTIPPRIEIELSNGCRIRIDEGVSLASLRRIVAALRG